MRKIIPVIAASFLCLTSLLSCSKNGYGVVLWDIAEYSLEDGKVIRIYGKSTISRTYIIAETETREKVEVPQWKIEVRGSFFSAQALAKKYADYRYKYATVALDGLPVRQDSMNTARQLYRLKKDEVIRVLKKGTGTAPMSGSERLEGDWLEILTSDGTRGWCFSYNLAIFDIREENAENAALNKNGSGGADGSYSLTYGQSNLTEEEMLARVLSQRWYPDSYEYMLRTHTVDTAFFGEYYGFYIDTEAKSLKLHFEDVDESFTYKSMTKQPSGSYQFDGTSVSMAIRNENHISVLYTNIRGMPATANCTYIKEDIDAIIAVENQRRLDAFREMLKNGSRFRAGEYGSVIFSANGKVTWNNAENLPGLNSNALDRNGSAEGSAEIKYFLSERMKDYYTGVLTLHFSIPAVPVATRGRRNAAPVIEGDNEESEGEATDAPSTVRSINSTGSASTGIDELNFFYTITENGIDLEDATNLFPSGNVFTDSGASPAIIHLTNG